MQIPEEYIRTTSIMFIALWGVICYGLLGTKLGMWTFRGK